MAGHATASSLRGTGDTGSGTALAQPPALSLTHSPTLSPTLSPAASPAERAQRTGRLHRGAARSVATASLVGRAHRTASQLLDPASDRWWHTAGVARRALQARAAVPAEDREVLVAAAWLHDVGYAPALVSTGFHPLDGARHLREAGWPEAVVGLVAHHSGARFLARVKGLDAELEDFADPRGWEGALADALAWADQTTSPQGHLVDVHDRLAEARARHGEGSDLALAHGLRAPVVRAAVAATEQRLALALRFDVGD